MKDLFALDTKINKALWRSRVIETSKESYMPKKKKRKPVKRQMY